MRKIITFILRYIYAAISCIYLFTAGILFAKNRSLIYEICNHFGYPKKSTQLNAAEQLIIPEIDLSEIIPEDISIKLLEPKTVDGNISFFETVVINELIRKFNPSNIFEIGTFDGRSTLNMAANCKKEAKIYTLDLPRDMLNFTKLSILPEEKKYIDKEKIGPRYLETDYKEKIIQLYGDSATFDFTPFYGMMDFLFIDGSHSYEYILNDSKQAFKLLRKEGNTKSTILWHDYGAMGLKGLIAALNELYLNNSKCRNLKHIHETSLVCLIIN